MSHHCTRTTANKLMFFENGRRVREGEYRQRYPNHNDQECLTTQQRRQRIQAAIRSLSGVKGEQDRLITECQTRLGRCNQRVAELEAQLLEKNKEFIERERDVRAEMKSDIEDLQKQLRKGKDCSEEIAELTQRMKEDLSVARREKDEINALLNASTSERERLSNQIGEITRREQNCNAQIQKTQAENDTLIDLREQEREKREKVEADLINLRAEHQKCNENLERVSRQLADSGKYQTQLEELRQEHSECQERTRKLMDENASLSSLPAQISVLNGETQVIREQMSNLVQQHLAELSGKTQKFDELQRKYDELSVDLSKLKDLEEKCKQNLISNREAHEILRSAKSALQGEYDQISEELQNMKRDLQRPAPVESAPALKASIQEVKNDSQELLVRIETLTTQIKEKDNENNQLREKNKSYVVEQTNLRDQQQYKREKAEAGLINLRAEYQKISEAKKTIERRIEMLESDNSSTIQKLRDCEKQKQSFEQALNNLSFDYRDLNTRHTTLNAQFSELQQQLKSAVEKEALSSSELKNFTEKMGKISRDARLDGESNAKLSNDIQRLMAELASKTGEIDGKNRELAELRQLHTQLIAEKEGAMREMANLKSEYENERLSNQQAFSELEAMKKEIETSFDQFKDINKGLIDKIDIQNKQYQQNILSLESKVNSSKTECDRNVQSLRQQLAQTEEMLKSKSEQLEGKELTLKTFMEERYQKKSKIEAELQQLQQDFNENNQKFAKQQEEWKNARDIIMEKEREYQGDISQKDEIIKRLNSDRQKLETMMREKEESLNRRLSDLRQQYEKCQSQPKAVQAINVSSPPSDALPITRPEGIKIDLSNVSEYPQYQQPEQLVMESSPSSLSSGESTPMVTPEEREAIPLNTKELKARLLAEKMKKKRHEKNEEDRKAKEAEKAEKSEKARQAKEARQAIEARQAEESEKAEKAIEAEKERRRKLRLDFDALKNGGLQILIENLDRAVFNMKPFANWNVEYGQHISLSNIVESDKRKNELNLGNNLKGSRQQLTDKQSQYLALKKIYDGELAKLNEGIKVWNQAIKEFDEKGVSKKSSVESQFSFGKRKKSKRPRSRGKKTIRKRRSTGRRSTNRKNRK